MKNLFANGVQVKVIVRVFAKSIADAISVVENRVNRFVLNGEMPLALESAVAKRSTEAGSSIECFTVVGTVDATFGNLSKASTAVTNALQCFPIEEDPFALTIVEMSSSPKK